MKNRFIANDTARLFGIGRFFEELTTHVVGGARLDDALGIDLEHPDWDSTVEVKASGSSQAPAVYSGQLERHLDQRGFPFRHCCYAIWIYRNTRQDRIGKKKLGTTLQLYTELAERTRLLFVFDARILGSVILKRGTTGLWRDGDYRSAHLRINTTWLRAFALAPAATLRGLGLKTRTFYVQQATVQTTFEDLPVRFDYTAVLPKSAAGYVWPIHRVSLTSSVAAPEVVAGQ